MASEEKINGVTKTEAKVLFGCSILIFLIGIGCFFVYGINYLSLMFLGITTVPLLDYGKHFSFLNVFYNEDGSTSGYGRILNFVSLMLIITSFVLYFWYEK